MVLYDLMNDLIPNRRRCLGRGVAAGSLTGRWMDDGKRLQALDVFVESS